jgi:hypothetical protein
MPRSRPHGTTGSTEAEARLTAARRQVEATEKTIAEVARAVTMLYAVISGE